MLNIGCKTKGNDNPKGKPRVWFCAHKDDYIYFNDVLADVFEYTNSAIYYDLNPADDTLDDDLNLLSEMNLFVMPVTSNLLYTDNRALNGEFVFALQHNIPILPILYEKGLDNQFYLKCGSMQYLDKTISDDTAISYAEKFKKFVSKTLLGDDMYDKVRKAFDAYIFLSYRKKDRAKAKELMSLIHANDFCRDIAIWYDEFLTPGEDFNTSISLALEKSELFVLAVTPNVVNEENYVMQIEYPEAVKAGKKIIPARLEDVNEQDLKTKYAGIPNSIDARNIQILADMLSNSLKDVALLANDGDPEHNYFIGLAYLYGIDVEVNNEMAVKLIQKASNEGLMLAHEKLADMYYNGEGVSRNLSKAIEFKTKSVKSRHDYFYKKPTVDNLDKFCDEMDGLADFYEISKNYSKTEKIYSSLIKEFEKISSPDDDVIVKRPLASAYYHHGNALKSLNDATCVSELETAVKLYEEVVNKTNKISDKRSLSKAYSSLSWAYMSSFEDGDNGWDEYGNKNWGPKKSGREFDSLNIALKVLKLDEEIANETGLIKDKRTIYYDYKNVYNSYLSLQDFQGEEALKLAKEYNKKALDYALSFEGLNDTLCNKILSSGYIELGDKHHNQKEYDKAEEYYLKACNLRKEIYDKNRTVSNAKNLHSAYYWLESNANSQNNYVKALEYSTEKIKLSKEIYSFVTTDETRNELANDYSSYAKILFNLGDKKGFDEYLEKSYDLQNENLKNILDSKLKAEKTYWNYQEKLSNSVIYKDYDGAKVNYEKLATAFEVLIKFQKETKNSFVISQGVTTRALADFFENKDYGDNKFHSEKFEDAIIYHKKAIEIFKIATEDTQMQNVSIAKFNLAREYELLAETYHYLGEEENVINSIDTAISCREQSFNDWVTCCKDEYKNSCMEFELVKTLVNYAWVYPTDIAAKNYKRAREILERIARKHPSDKKFAKKYFEVCRYIELYYNDK